jgi:hypothetical protein
MREIERNWDEKDRGVGGSRNSGAKNEKREAVKEQRLIATFEFR